MKENHTTQFSCSQEYSDNKFEITDADREMENGIFEAYLRNECQEDPKIVRTRMQYVREYCLFQPEFDGIDYFVSDEPVRHCIGRNSRLKKSRLSENEFYSFELMQRTISDLGLCPKATFEFILYLWFHLSEWAKHGILENMEEKIFRLMKRMEEKPNDQISLDIKIGSKHFKFENEHFVRSIVEFVQSSNVEALNLTERIYPKKRELEYLLLMTLFQNLPIKYEKEKKCAFTQSERNFGLCVLWLTGNLNHDTYDDPQDYCTYVNNGVFNNLMKDYTEVEVPHIGQRF